MPSFGEWHVVQNDLLRGEMYAIRTKTLKGRKIVQSLGQLHLTVHSACDHELVSTSYENLIACRKEVSNAETRVCSHEVLTLWC